MLGEREPDKFVMADSREQIGKFRNVCVKPNKNECYRALGLEHPHPDSIHGCFPHYLSDQVAGPVFLTRGAEGITFAFKRAKPGVPDSTEIAAYTVAGPIDICGAGDSCSAGIASAMVSGLTHEQAAAFGNLVASITIQQIGVTGTATPEQVRARWPFAKRAPHHSP